LFVINTLQYPLFCVVKASVLQRNSACFASQNRHYYKVKALLLFSYDNIFTKWE